MSEQDDPNRTWVVVGQLQGDVLELRQRIDELERRFQRAQGGLEQSLEPPFGEVFKDKP